MMNRGIHSLPVVCGLLLLAVALVFGKTVRYDFVNLDDNVLVYENPMVTRGVTAQGIAWACTANVANMWYPLTWISYMLDSQMYGPKPWGYHFTNVLLHAATTVILFLTLRRMTGNLWASALVALLFAIHPLRAEAVAWVGERKSPLSGLFFVSTIAAYSAYARRPFSLVRYLAVAGLFTLGLLAKPTLVTLPFVLLLLDYWPLRRERGAGSGGEREKGREGEREKGRKGGAPGAGCSRSGSACGSRVGEKANSPLLPFSPAPLLALRLVVEKIPLLLLSVACCVAAVVSQAGNIQSLQRAPVSARIANALISYVVYLRQFFWPVGLAAFYPRSESLPAWQVATALVVLAAVSVAALLLWRKQPAVLVGWLWYLGTLVPTIGLVPIGDHAGADRYTYLPQIGLCIALVWGVRWGVQRFWGGWPSGRWLAGVGGALLVAGLMACAWQQVAYWKDGKTLWSQTLACTSENWFAHTNLGTALVRRGQVDQAIDQYRQALEIKPDDAAALNNLAWIRATHPDSKLRDGALAVALARRARNLTSSNANVLDTLAAAYAEAGRFAEAAQTAHKAVDLARQQGKPALAESIRVKIPLYDAGMPFHESPAKTAP